jgi:hypothetical protein
MLSDHRVEASVFLGFYQVFWQAQSTFVIKLKVLGLPI